MTRIRIQKVIPNYGSGQTLFFSFSPLRCLHVASPFGLFSLEKNIGTLHFPFLGIMHYLCITVHITFSSVHPPPPTPDQLQSL
jgi:hypothetical protein